MDDEFRNIMVGDFYDKYEVDRSGNVRSLQSPDRIVLKHSVDRQGYHFVDLRNKTKRKHAMVHRLVAEAFIENPDPDNKTQVNHINGDKSDNHVDNLEWVSPKENVAHSYATGLAKIGTSRHNASLTTEEVLNIRNCIINGTETCVSLGVKYGVDASVISEVARGVSYKDVPGPVAEKKIHTPLFSDEQILQIMRECERDTQRHVAVKYGVSQQYVSKIILKYKKEHHHD